MMTSCQHEVIDCCSALKITEGILDDEALRTLEYLKQFPVEVRHNAIRGCCIRCGEVIF